MTLAIHASADDKTIAEDIEWVTNKFDNAYWAFENPDCEPCVPGKDFFYAQTIVGLVDVIGAISVDPKWSKKEKRKRIAAAGFDKMYAEWAEGPYSFLLSNPRRFKTGIQCRGNLKIWKLTPEIQAYVETAELLPVPTGEEFGLLPTKPHGIVKCLGKPIDPESDEAAFAELDRLDAEDSM
jgi:hypothetical protein